MDTEFWFVAPEVWAAHGDNPIVLRFAAGPDPADVLIELPANPGFAPINISLPANGSQSVNLTAFLNSIENRPANTMLQKGIHITSTNEVSCYYEIDHGLNADIFVLKGENALGTEFLIPFQTGQPSHYNEAPSGFDIVATTDNTSITITPTKNLIGHPANIPFTIVLNEGETYSCRAQGLSGAAHPSGTHIVSDAPIAVTMSDDSVEQNSGGQICFDLIGDQCTPIDQAGTEFIALRGGLTNGERVYVMATQDGTTVTANGNQVGGVLAAGESATITITTPSIYIETSAPALALQVTGFGCELGAGFLPALGCTGSSEVVFVRSNSDGLRLNVLAPAGIEGSFSVNGNPNLLQPSSFAVVPNSGGAWLYAQLVNPGWATPGAAMRVVNSAGTFHLGMLMGNSGEYGRFGFFSDFAQPAFDLSLSTGQDVLCSGDSVQFQPALSSPATVQWYFNDLPLSTEDTLTIPALDVADAGTYVLTGSTEWGCPIESDTLEIEVLPAPLAPVVSATDPACAGVPLDLVAVDPGGLDSIVWTSPAGLTTPGPDLNFAAATDALNGTWTAQAYGGGCESVPAEVDVEVTALLVLDITETTLELCEGDEWVAPAAVNVPAGSSTDLAWSGPGGATEPAGGVAWTDDGWWVLEGNVDGCEVEADSVELNVALEQVLVLGLPAYLCTASDPFELTTSYIGPGYWDASCTFCINGSSGLFDPAAAGNGTVEVTYYGTGTCEASMTASFDILLTPDPGVVEPAPICVGTSELPLAAALTGGVWASPGCAGCVAADGTFYPSQAGTGTWNVTYETAGDCPASDALQVEVVANPPSTFSPLDDRCEEWGAINLTPATTGGQFSGTAINAGGYFAPTGPGTYEISYTLPGECGSTTTESLVIQPTPDAAFDVPESEGCVPFVVEAFGVEPVGGGNSIWYFLPPSGNATGSTENDAATFTLAEPGCADLSRTVTSAAGCSATFEAANVACAAPSPSANFTYAPIAPTPYAPHVTATAIDWEPADSVAVNWAWSYGEFAGVLATGTEVLADMSIAPTLCLTVTDTVGCASTTCRVIELVEPLDFFIPTAFSPDGDGLNEAWQLTPFGFEPWEIRSFKVSVFDRWGQILFSSTDPSAAWVGDIAGGSHFAEDGVYNYLLRLQLIDGRRLERTGAVLLVR